MKNIMFQMKFLVLKNVSQYHINIFTSWLAMALGIIVIFFLTPYFISTFGDYKYGIWLLINSLIGYVNLAEAGVNISTGRFVNIYVGQKEYKKATEILSTSLLFFLALPCVFLPLIAVFSPFLIDNFITTTALANDIHQAAVITSAVLFFNLISANIRIPLNVNSRFDLVSLVEIMSTLTRTVLILYFLSNKDTQTLTFISIATLAASLMSLLLSVFITRRYGKNISVSFSRAKYSAFIVIISFGGWVLLSNFGVMAINYSDNIIISYFIGVSDVAYYAIGFMLSKYIVSILSKISQVKTPKITQLIGSGSTAKLSQEYVEILTITGVFALPAVIVFLYQIESFIYLWMGKQYAISILIGVVLTIPCIFSFAMQGIGATLWAKGIVKTLGITKLCIAVANLLISISLVHILENQLLGIALGTAITSMIETLIILPFFARRVIGIKFRSMITVHILFVAFSLLLFLFFKSFYPLHSDTWGSLILNSLVLFVIGIFLGKVFFKAFKSKLHLPIIS